MYFYTIILELEYNFAGKEVILEAIFNDQYSLIPINVYFIKKKKKNKSVLKPI